MKIFTPEDIYFEVYYIPVTYKLEKLYRNKKLLFSLKTNTRV